MCFSTVSGIVQQQRLAQTGALIATPCPCRRSAITPAGLNVSVAEVAIVCLGHLLLIVIAMLSPSPDY